MGSLAAYIRHEGPADEAIVRRMLAASPHRGTHAEVSLLDRACVAVSNVLGQADASVAERDGLLAAVVGRIDNLTELAKRFQQQDSRSGASPAEVVLAVFASVREDAPTFMRGMFAAAVTDGRRMWCFRDHLSLGAMLHRQEPNAFYVATEAKQVVAGAGIPREPDLETVEGWFYGDVREGIEGETSCALKGVRRSARGTIMVSDGARSRVRRYWHPDRLFETARFSEDELLQRFEGLLAQAVERTLTGNDVISLSGGIDSPAVTAYAAARHVELSGRPVGALSLVFPDFPQVDERRYVEVVARRFGADLHMFQPVAQPLDHIADWVRLCDSPAPVHPPAEAAEFYRRARGLGYDNVIGGELAEYLTAQRAGLLTHLVSHGRLSAIPAVVRSQRDIGISWLGIARQFVLPLMPRAALVARQRRRRWEESYGLPMWVDRRTVNEASAGFVQAPRRRYRWEQVGFFVGPPIGTESDETVQAVCGIRNRRPWVDVDLSEFFVSLPAEVKYPDFRFKTLVRRLLRGRVPDEILDRTDKTYFNQRILGTIDWDALRSWLVRPNVRVGGVDYGLLGELIERRAFDIGDAKWAVDLAKVHAFLSQWE